jgi:hypothetical protein
MKCNGLCLLLALSACSSTSPSSTTNDGGTATTPDASVACSDPPPSLPGGGTAVATFESVGLYWSAPPPPGASGCQVQYRKTSECAWSAALPLWFDTRDDECRGALVHLTPGTDYVVQLGIGDTFTHELAIRTWSDAFPIGETIVLPATSSDSLVITEGGTADAYKLYTAAPGGSTIDVANARATNVTISAPYVIIRGLTLRGAQQHGIRLNDGAHDVVIEDNDIAGWGRIDTDAGALGASSVVWGVYGDSGVYSASMTVERVIIQRNRIHHPRTDSNSWGENRVKYNSAHPRGPNGIYLIRTAGHIVIRYNDIYSDLDHMYNDVIGGDENFSDNGFPNRDSDIYGNRLGHAWDDAIEAEGGNKNVRIWGNYMDRTTTGVATSSTFHGPVYIFRNVFNRARTNQTVSLDQDSRLYFGKSGSVSPWGRGRRYMFHNTLLQPTDPSAMLPLGAGSGISGNGTDRPIENTITRNNIWHIWKPWWASIDTRGGTGNDFDYDLYNGNISAHAGAEANGIDLGDTGAPQYEEGHGWRNEAGGRYQLAPGSRGHDQGASIPNFNDDHRGAKPDIGAHEGGSPDMQIGACAGEAPLPHFCP